MAVILVGVGRRWRHLTFLMLATNFKPIAGQCDGIMTRNRTMKVTRGAKVLESRRFWCEGCFET